jgi:hypothetical protein
MKILGDPIEFLSWLINSLHITLNGTKNSNSSIIYKTFQGQMKVYTKKIAPVDLVFKFVLKSYLVQKCSLNLSNFFF